MTDFYPGQRVRYVGKVKRIDADHVDWNDARFIKKDSNGALWFNAGGQDWCVQWEQREWLVPFPLEQEEL